uniref:Uncharacterized protein n=1 Tax=Rhizophora mucronata TaxID=61149 RepID=A0A2P2NX59_RHIMU
MSFYIIRLKNEKRKRKKLKKKKENIIAIVQSPYLLNTTGPVANHAHKKLPQPAVEPAKYPRAYHGNVFPHPLA